MMSDDKGSGVSVDDRVLCAATEVAMRMESGGVMTTVRLAEVVAGWSESDDKAGTVLVGVWETLTSSDCR